MKRGQAALEFLSTYGWAVVVVLIALGAMTWLGWTPSGLLPSKCVVEPPFGCTDSHVGTDGRIRLELDYLLGHRLDYVMVNISTFNCDLIPGGWINTLPVEEGRELDYENDGVIDFSCTPETAPTYDDKFIGQILVTYKEQDSPISHKAVGSFQRRVE